MEDAVAGDLSKARLKRVSSRPVWSLLVWGSSPVWHTKSVSELSSTMTHPASSLATTTAPSLAPRPAFLWAVATPDLRSQSTAASRSPSAAAKASTHFFIGAEVRARSSLISAVFGLVAIGRARHEARASRGKGRSMLRRSSMLRVLRVRGGDGLFVRGEG